MDHVIYYAYCTTVVEHTYRIPVIIIYNIIIVIQRQQKRTAPHRTGALVLITRTIVSPDSISDD